MKFVLILTMLFATTLSFGTSPREISFEDVIKEIVSTYAPLLKSIGFDLKYDWTMDSQSYAKRVGNTLYLVMTNPGREFTNDAQAVVVCHELGHHLGGGPLRSGSKWAANEGEAYYFAGAKCLKKIFEKQKNSQEIIRKLNVNPDAVKKCSKVFINPEERAVCIRVAHSGELYFRTQATIGNLPLPSISTPDLTISSNANDPLYPSVQCVVDIIFQGALCEIPSDSPKTCTAETGYKIGMRPSCWFPPHTYRASDLDVLSVKSL